MATGELKIRHAESTRRWYERNREVRKAACREYYEANKEKIKEYQRVYNARNREKIRAWRSAYYQSNKAALVRRKYGMLPAEIERLWVDQDKSCAACGEAASLPNLVVDHDHRSGEVRGLVHQRCNHAIGHAYDSATRLRRIADYLDRTSTVDEIVA